MTHLENHDVKSDRQGDGLLARGEQPDHGEGDIHIQADGVGRALGGASDQPAFGDLLRQARELRGLDIESCGQALRLPVRLLRKLERGDYQGVDYQVYLQGYLRKYGTHVGLDAAAIEAEIERVRPGDPALVSAGGIPRSRYLLERYATATTYIVLTAVIVVPLVWLGVRGGLGRDIAHLAPLDSAPVATTASRHAQSVNVPATTTPVANERPLQASMAPFSALDAPAIPKPQPVKVKQPVAAPASGEHTLTLSLDAPSWVEITAADGKQIEYSLLPAGTRRSYDTRQPLNVRIGNADGTELTLDGKPLALDAFRRANVAHLHIGFQDGHPVTSRM